MIKLIAFKSHHLDNFTPKYLYSDSALTKEDYKEFGRSGFLKMHSLFEDGKYLGLVGVEFMSAKTMEVFAFFSDVMPKSKLQFCKVIKNLLEWYIKMYNLNRAQMVVRCGFKENWRFAEILGMKREAIMEKYGPTGDDYYLYARTN